MKTSITDQLLMRLIIVIVFAAAMGLLEAVCVIYIREIIIPAGYQITHPVAPLQQLPFETLREACTIVMLITVAWLAGSRWLNRIYYFFIMFGVWDILYYIGLKILQNWPSSFLDWDCLFLIPVPWYSPVIVPILISVYFISAGTLLLFSDSTNGKTKTAVPGYLMQLLAFLLWYFSFVWNNETIATSGYKNVEYSWVLLVAGMVCGIAGIWIILKSNRKSGGIS